MKHKPKLTRELETTILSWVRAGGYPHVAAAAAGVSEERWQLWRERSTRREPYKSFFAAIAQAHATARLKAETTTLEQDARFWLKHGPGREGPSNPGWTTMVGPMLMQTNETFSVFASAEFLQFMSALRAALAPYPDAMLALSLALDEGTSLRPNPTGVRQPMDDQESSNTLTIDN